MARPPEPSAEPELEQNRPAAIHSPALWGLFAGVAFLVFRLTADPVVAASAFCLKFALRDVAIASRLLIADPNYLRGVICGLLQVSLGAMKSLGASLGAAFLIGVVFGQGFQLQGVVQGQAFKTSFALLMLAGWSWGAAALVALAGTVVAWQTGQKVWLSAGTLDCLQQGNWPPRPTDTRNQLGIVVMLELTVVLALVFAVLFVMLVNAGGGPRNAPLLLPMVVGTLIGGVLPVALAIFLFWLGGRLMAAIQAQSPAECWPDDSDAAPL